MRNYYNSSLTESEAQLVDSGEVASGSGSMGSYAAQHSEAIRRARQIVPADKARELCRRPSDASEDERRAVNTVWDCLPGDTCWLDACRLVAYAP